MVNTFFMSEGRKNWDLKIKFSPTMQKIRLLKGNKKCHSASKAKPWNRHFAFRYAVVGFPLMSVTGFRFIRKSQMQASFVTHVYINATFKTLRFQAVQLRSFSLQAGTRAHTLRVGNSQVSFCSVKHIILLVQWENCLFERWKAWYVPEFPVLLENCWVIQAKKKSPSCT